MGMMFLGSDFNARKAAQVAAFFVIRQGKLLNVVKLIKLVYLANREFMAVYEEPMFMDTFVSMRHGPVNSQVYDYVNIGGLGWDDFISDRANHDVALADPTLTDESFDELSEADVEVLTGVWHRFGSLNQWELIKYTHDNCPEWENPGLSSFEIPYSRIFKHLNKPDPLRLEKKILDQRQQDKFRH